MVPVEPRARPIRQKKRGGEGGRHETPEGNLETIPATPSEHLKLAEGRDPTEEGCLVRALDVFRLPLTWILVQAFLEEFVPPLTHGVFVGAGGLLQHLRAVTSTLKRRRRT